MCLRKQSSIKKEHVIDCIKVYKGSVDMRGLGFVQGRQGDAWLQKGSDKAAVGVGGVAGR